MGHIHPVYDTDSHFSINPITREIKNESSAKIRLIQHDHNSERFSFDIPKMIEGHDMTTCNVIQVHYINIDSQTKEDKRGIYEVDDMQVKQDDEDTACFSWLISGNATKFSGSLNFLIRFCCVTGDSVDYAWNTELHTGISVSNGLYNGEEIAEDYSDILEQWREELFGSGGGASTPGKDGREIELQNNGTAIRWRYVGDESWTDLVQLSDITGATPNIQIGTVQTLDPGQQATASMTGTPENPLLNLGIPKGENGGSEITVQQMQNTDTTVTLQTNILYIFPEMATLDVTIPQTEQEIHFFFDSGATATVFSLQAQSGAQGKQCGLIGGEEQNGGGHAQRPRKEGGELPSLLPTDQLPQQGKRQETQAGADQPQSVDGIDSLRPQKDRRPGIDRRFCQHEGQKAQGEADGLEPLFPGEIPNGIVFLLYHTCFTSPRRKDHVPVLTDYSG